MSDIVIPNAKLPTNCFTCDYEKLTENCPCYIGICSASGYKDSRHKDCPLAKIPTQHGRLIDANKLSFAVADAQAKLRGKDYDSFMLLGDVLRWIELADTVVEASK